MALRFIKRHPKKCTATLLFGGFISGAYFLYNRIKHQLMGSYQQMQLASLENDRKRHHFQSNLQTADARVFAVSLSLRAKLLELADVEFLVRQLREGGPEKDVLWENLKITSFTRLITSLYLLSGLTLLVRIEFNIIGGVMFNESQADSKAPDREFLLKGKDVIQRQYIEYCNYFIDNGCARLLASVEPVVRRVLNRFSLKQVVSFAELDIILAEIQDNLEKGKEDGEKIIFQELFLPKETPEPDEDLDLLLDYTRDILDQDFPHLLSSCVQAGFLYISRWTAAQRPVTDRDDAAPETELHVQFARLVISVSKCFEALFADNQDSILHQLLTKREVLIFSQHIYEAFSNS